MRDQACVTFGIETIFLTPLTVFAAFAAYSNALARGMGLRVKVCLRCLW